MVDIGQSDKTGGWPAETSNKQVQGACCLDRRSATARINRCRAGTASPASERHQSDYRANWVNCTRFSGCFPFRRLSSFHRRAVRAISTQTVEGNFPIIPVRRAFTRGCRQNLPVSKKSRVAAHVKRSVFNAVSSRTGFAHKTALTGAETGLLRRCAGGCCLPFHRSAQRTAPLHGASNRNGQGEDFGGCRF